MKGADIIAPRESGICLMSLAKSAIGTEAYHSVETWIDLGDAVQVRPYHL